MRASKVYLHKQAFLTTELKPLLDKAQSPYSSWSRNPHSCFISLSDTWPSQAWKMNTTDPVGATAMEVMAPEVDQGLQKNCSLVDQKHSLLSSLLNKRAIITGFSSRGETWFLTGISPPVSCCFLSSIALSQSQVHLFHFFKS